MRHQRFPTLAASTRHAGAHLAIEIVDGAPHLAKLSLDGPLERRGLENEKHHVKAIRLVIALSISPTFDQERLPHAAYGAERPARNAPP